MFQKNQNAELIIRSFICHLMIIWLLFKTAIKRRKLLTSAKKSHSQSPQLLRNKHTGSPQVMKIGARIDISKVEKCIILLLNDGNPIIMTPRDVDC